MITIKSILGVFFGILSGSSLILNIIALFTVFRLAFVLRKNHVYIIAFFNILSDVLQMTIATFYQVE
uniref:G_PROTEIN_RECEP_F1_2 domain-containing protein n=1 Tax=Caenorhabditis tropicalis TaxID=1561998 RepID=A0A1I7UK97_9PELO